MKGQKRLHFVNNFIPVISLRLIVRLAFSRLPLGALRRYTILELTVTLAIRKTV